MEDAPEWASAGDRVNTSGWSCGLGSCICDSCVPPLDTPQSSPRRLTPPPPPLQPPVARRTTASWRVAPTLNVMLARADLPQATCAWDRCLHASDDEELFEAAVADVDRIIAGGGGGARAGARLLVVVGLLRPPELPSRSQRHDGGRLVQGRPAHCSGGGCEARSTNPHHHHQGWLASWPVHHIFASPICPSGLWTAYQILESPSTVIHG